MGSASCLRGHACAATPSRRRRGHENGRGGALTAFARFAQPAEHPRPLRAARGPGREQIFPLIGTHPPAAAHAGGVPMRPDRGLRVLSCCWASKRAGDARQAGRLQPRRWRHGQRSQGAPSHRNGGLRGRARRRRGRTTVGRCGACLAASPPNGHAGAMRSSWTKRWRSCFSRSGAEALSRWAWPWNWFSANKPTCRRGTWPPCRPSATPSRRGGLRPKRLLGEGRRCSRRGARRRSPGGGAACVGRWDTVPAFPRGRAGGKLVNGRSKGAQGEKCSEMAVSAAVSQFSAEVLVIAPRCPPPSWH